jgi:hypothetical protein
MKMCKLVAMSNNETTEYIGISELEQAKNSFLIIHPTLPQWIVCECSSVGINKCHPTPKNLKAHNYFMGA